MKNGAYISVKINRQKVEKVRKLYKTATPQQTLEEILDNILYMDKMERHLKKYRGKAHFKKVYE